MMRWMLATLLTTALAAPAVAQSVALRFSP
jgi:hypothetical protein